MRYQVGRAGRAILRQLGGTARVLVDLPCRSTRC